MTYGGAPAESSQPCYTRSGRGEALAGTLVRGGFQPRLPTSLPPPGRQQQQQQQPSPLPRRQPVQLMPPAQLHSGAPQVVAPAPAVPLQSPPPSEQMDVDPSAGPPSQAVAVQPVLQPLSLGTPKESDTALSGAHSAAVDAPSGDAASLRGSRRPVASIVAGRGGSGEGGAVSGDRRQCGGTGGCSAGARRINKRRRLALVRRGAEGCRGAAQRLLQCVCPGRRQPQRQPAGRGGGGRPLQAEN
ncbi:translation initiation factor IF-2-like [Schistocerca americana]|uniref:translation initiation factor IF-2-like n=1 Tax=Schistocerca americana TaxID=7009 RepID=UPI001F4F33AA|nr:translation initiation factor IF-2-like [Schistocerca americana]